MYYIVKRYMNTIPDNLKMSMVTWLAEEENQEAIESYMTKMAEIIRHKITSSLGGFMSGIEREAAAAEGDLEHEALTGLTGNPAVSAIATRYLEDKPLLKALLTGFATRQMASKPGFNTSGANATGTPPRAT